MSDIKEATEVRISEKIKEIKLSLSTIDSAFTSTTTRKINGFLEVIHIHSDKQVKIKIFAEEHPHLMIYENINFHGAEHLFVRPQLLNFKGERINFSSDKFALNDKLIIEVSGNKNANVDVFIRYT